MKKQRRARGLIVIFLAISCPILYTGCQKEFKEYYELPANLKGPIYEQLKSDPDFSEFVTAIDKFPKLAQDINTSGLYTVFAPTNEAIKAYLADKFPGKSSIADFNINNHADSVALSELVQMHVLLNMYFEYDFNKGVDITTKADPLGVFNSNDKYRYITRYKDPAYYVYDKTYKKYRLIAPDNKKVVVYSRNFLNKYSLWSDYQALFGIVADSFNVDRAQVIRSKKDIAAKNGVIHGINNVLEKFPYIDELIAQKNQAFYTMLNNNVVLVPNTYDANISKDTTFQKLYSVYDLLGSQSYANSMYSGWPLNSDRYDYDWIVLCPSGSTFMDFINDKVLKGFDNNFDSIHPFTKALILDSYIIASLTNSTNLQSQALNYAGDTLKGLIFTDRARASNGIVYTVNNEILSPAFSSVAKVPLLDKKYSFFLNLLTSFTNGYGDLYITPSNINYLKVQNRKFTLIVPANSAFTDAFITWGRDGRGLPDFFGVGGARLYQSQKDSIVNSLIIPDVSVGPNDNYKWYFTRNGDYILFDKGTIQGTVTYSTVDQASNGYVYTTDVLPERPNTTLKTVLNSIKTKGAGYSIFVDSILSTQQLNGQTFMSMLDAIGSINSYTVLMPPDSSLTRFKTDNNRGPFSKDSIWQFIASYHILGTRLFSEGTFHRVIGNPLPADDSKFVTLYDKDVYNNIFIKDIFAWIQANFNSQRTFTSEDGVTANIVYPFDKQGTNGVVHAVDRILVPPSRQYHH